MSSENQKKDYIRKLALDLGYDLAGFAPTEITDEDRKNLLQFVRQEKHGTMAWFKKHLPFRLHIRRMIPEAQSALVLASFYNDQEKEQLHKNSSIKISRYAMGRDYHRFLRKKGKKLIQKISEVYPELQARVTVDSAPVPEKVLARYAGIGWQGKNTNIIHPERGSYFFISVLFLNIVFEPDSAISDHCKSCRLCIDACPTDALEPYRIDARKCLSYLTIEAKEPIAGEFYGSGWIFGCDICQEICPFNRRPSQRRFLPLQNSEFPIFAVTARLMSEENTLSDASADFDAVNYGQRFQGSPLRRIDGQKLKSNARAAVQKVGT